MSQQKIKPKTRDDLVDKVKKVKPDYQEKRLPRISPPTTKLKECSFEDIQPTEINWLWLNRIARGAITLFAGEPGKGKSQLLLWLAAACTNNSISPLDKSAFPQGKVGIMASEDDEENTMWPRLKAVNANLSMIFNIRNEPRHDSNGNLLDDMVRLDQDMQRLDYMLEGQGYVLLIIDPITAYLGDINDYKNSEVRTLLAKLTRVAKKHNIAVILNTHLSKQSGNQQLSSIINRITGSHAYAAVARSVYLICDDPDDAQYRLFLPVKNNIGIDKGGFRYEIKGVTVDGGDKQLSTCRIQWCDESVDISANDAMNKERPSPKRDEAKLFIQECLKNGSMLVKDIRSRAKDNKISVSVLYAAKDELGVIEDVTEGYNPLKIWSLPSRNN